MAQVQPYPRAKANLNLTKILKSLAPLFYISRLLGIVPFSLVHYWKYKVFKASLVSIIWGLVISIANTTQYYISMNNSLQDNRTGDTNTLTSVIGIFIVALEPFMMITSIVMLIIYRSTLTSCLTGLAKVDEKLQGLTATPVDHLKPRKIVVMLITVTCICEVGLVLFNFMQFTISEDIIFQSYWWFASGVPIFCDALSRIWFLLLICLVKIRFQAVNSHCLELYRMFKERRAKLHSSKKESSNTQVPLGYLTREIVDPKKRPRKVVIVQPNPIQLQSINQTPVPNIFTTENAWNADSPICVDEKMDKKLIELAKVHDELSQIAKMTNKIFRFQILLTMAYGFMSITAQLYFLYCGLVGQVIPVLFRSAESIGISMIYILYTSAKCVSVIFVSWKVKLESQKTGIFLHKLANVVDENHFYHIVNHLSLKLLNNQLALTACGFFELDMTTIYAVSL